MAAFLDYMAGQDDSARPRQDAAPTDETLTSALSQGEREQSTHGARAPKKPGTPEGGNLVVLDFGGGTCDVAGCPMWIAKVENS